MVSGRGCLLVLCCCCIMTTALPSTLPGAGEVKVVKRAIGSPHSTMLHYFLMAMTSSDTSHTPVLTSRSIRRLGSEFLGKRSSTKAESTRPCLDSNHTCDDLTVKEKNLKEGSHPHRDSANSPDNNSQILLQERAALPIKSKRNALERDGLKDLFSILMSKKMGNEFLGKRMGSEFLGKRSMGSTFFSDRFSQLFPKYRAVGSDYFGKRIVGSEFLGKRAMGSEFLGKRAMGSEFLGKRAMGSEFLGKRAMGNEFLGKRAMGSEFLGKRAVGSEFLGKRAMGSEFLGKRGMGSEFLGKRMSNDFQDKTVSNIKNAAG